MRFIVDNSEKIEPLIDIPVLPLRDVVVYPYMVIPLFVGRERSIKSLEVATKDAKQVILVTQKDSANEQPDGKHLYDIGTLANILQLLTLPDGTVKVLVEGLSRVKIADYKNNDEYLVADGFIIDQEEPTTKETDILIRSLLSQFEQYVKLNKKIPPEVISSLSSIEEVSRMADTVAAHMTLKLENKQLLLAETDLEQRVEKLMVFLESEIDIQHIEKRIRNRVKKQMEKSQREYYLNEQLKAVQKELAEYDDSANEIDELVEKINKANMPVAAKDKAASELKKLKLMSQMSAEATVVRNYLEWLTDIPWSKRSRISKSLNKAMTVLNEDHFGLEKVKERIIEYLAVQQRVKKLKGPILCLVGPPGVGKTSVAQSIARATNRKYTRMALGGVRDEAEIRGHRRTYIGSMPGKVIQNITKANTKNPLFLFDEIDKMAQDFRGDPASALLEVLDPEQNAHFADHYLEIDYDLSDVLFICTANSLNIPDALRDRMEIIHLSGYTEDEKFHIAQRYLIPKAQKEAGLVNSELTIDDDALLNIIRCYTREAGVRHLQREIAKICRKVVKEVIEQPDLKSITVDTETLTHYLGVHRFQYGISEGKDQVGQVTGLAWTEVGGELLTIETAIMPGKGKATYTGKLGDVMQESIQAATTVVRSRSEVLAIEPDILQKHDVHFHVPEGATPKDGPSAGIGMCTALVSAITGIPVKSSVAMTGEITLRGEVLAIGGLKEKLLAAHRGGIKTVLIPKDNVKDLIDIPDTIKNHIEIIAVKWIDEVLSNALSQTINQDVMPDDLITKEGNRHQYPPTINESTH